MCAPGTYSNLHPAKHVHGRAADSLRSDEERFVGRPACCSNPEFALPFGTAFPGSGGRSTGSTIFLTGNRLEIEPSLIKTLSEKFFPNRSKLILHSFINVGYLLYFEIIEQTQILVVENHFIVFKICP